MERCEEKMSEKIRETGELFDAVQTVGNRAVSRLGYNRPYTFSENLTVSYEITPPDPRFLTAANMLI